MNFDPTLAHYQPEPVIFTPFRLAMATSARSKARQSMCTAVARTRTIASPGEREFDLEAARERDGRRRGQASETSRSERDRREEQLKRRTSHHDRAREMMLALISCMTPPLSTLA